MFFIDASAESAGAITPGSAPNLSERFVIKLRMPEPASNVPLTRSESKMDELSAWNCAAS